MTTKKSNLQSKLFLEGDKSNQFFEIPLSQIKPNLSHFRKDLLENEIRDLAKSILDVGLIHPILVRELEDGYMIISGLRRFKAFEYLCEAHQDRFNKIPCRIDDSSLDPAIISLVENIQRESLTPLEESETLLALIQITKKGYKDLGEMLGKNEDYVENRIRYLRIHKSLKSRIDTFSPGKDFFFKFNRLSLAKVLMLKPLYTHFVERECYDFLNRIIDEEMTVKEIKSELCAWNENRLNRRLLPSTKEKSEALKVFEGLGLDNTDKSSTHNPISILKQSKSRVKKDNPLENLYIDDQYWNDQIELLKNRLRIMIKKVNPFKEGFQRLIKRYGEPILAVSA